MIRQLTSFLRGANGRELRLYQDEFFLSVLIWTIGVIAFSGVTLACISLLESIGWTLREHWPPCLASKCIEETKELASGAISILEGTIALVVVMSTVGGILIALRSYMATRAATVFGNHITQLQTFRSFIETEINRHPAIQPQSVNVFALYSYIFEASRRGRMDSSDRYRQVLGRIRSIILASNRRATSAKDTTQKGWRRFQYKDHQELMIEAFGRMGITVYGLPRLTYFELETALLDMIEGMNNAFLGDERLSGFPQRLYM